MPGCVISIVGKSGVGKTTLIERLIPELNALSLRVSVIKHAGKDAEVEFPHKDSHRIFFSGAAVSVVVSDNKVSLVKRLENSPSLREIVKLDGFLNDSDIVITEGFKKEEQKKIELFREGFSEDILSDASEVLFFVSDSKRLKERYLVFDFDEIDNIVTFIVLYMAIKSNSIFVGVGNTLKGDDGFGVEVIKRIKKLIPSVRFIDAGVAAENYISFIVQQRPKVVVIFDAVLRGRRSGELKTYSHQMLMNTDISTHGGGVKMFVSYLMKEIGLKVFLVGINPIDLSLSEKVSEPIGEVVDKIVKFFEKNYA